MAKKIAAKAERETEISETSAQKAKTKSSTKPFRSGKQVIADWRKRQGIREAGEK